VSAERTENTGELESLARRAVACKHWRWMPGMVTTLGLRIDAVYEREPYRSGRYYDDFGELQHTREHEPEPLPDLIDAATLGCLLALVREAWGDIGVAAVTGAYSYEKGYEFRVIEGHHHGMTFHAMSQVRHESEASALVAALEAAP
jgi:hypothetical protein